MSVGSRLRFEDSRLPVPERHSMNETAVELVDDHDVHLEARSLWESRKTHKETCICWRCDECEACEGGCHLHTVDWQSVGLHVDWNPNRAENEPLEVPCEPPCEDYESRELDMQRTLEVVYVPKAEARRRWLRAIGRLKYAEARQETDSKPSQPHVRSHFCGKCSTTHMLPEDCPYHEDELEASRAVVACTSVITWHKPVPPEVPCTYCKCGSKDGVCTLCQQCERIQCERIAKRYENAKRWREQ